MTSASRSSSWPRWAAWGFLLLIFLVINADVIHRPLKHTTMPTYRLAATQWWMGQDVYNSDRAHDAFLYFPQAAVIFTPFNILPFYLCEIFWRAVVFGLFAYALVRLSEVFLSGSVASSGKTFLVLALLAVPSSLASLRNAQFDLPLAALIVLASMEMARNRWNMATVWLCTAIALKPLAIVPLLLFGALYWKLIPRLIAGLLIVIAIPFLHWNPAFVAHEYVRCFETLVWAAKADEARYSDLAALISHMGIYPPDWLKTLVRIIFALVYLGLGFGATRRLSGVHAAWTIGALSTDYLMLFNPRTETCSYVFLGPFVASLALLYARRPDRKWFAFLLGFAALGFACDAIPYIHYLTDRWFKPLLALLFLPVLIEFIFGRAIREKESLPAS
ncbi:MAG TPA: glycosyltransferase family 87 protein [Candidatus Methylacidiphilales bacterium]